MSILTILQKNIKWRFHNAFTIVITILQPVLWLVLYSQVAKQSMKGSGIENYAAFLLPGLFVLVSFASCSSGGIMNYLMKTQGSFYRVLIAPVSRSAIVLGQILEAVLCSFLEIGIMGMIGFLFLSVKIAAGFWGYMLIILLLFLTAFFMAALSYGISLLLPNEVVYETMMNAIVLPVFFLSSALFRVDGMTGGLAVLIQLNPFTHVINALRSLILYGESKTSNILFVISLFVIMDILSFLWALNGLKKETKL